VISSRTFDVRPSSAVLLGTLMTPSAERSNCTNTPNAANKGLRGATLDRWTKRGKTDIDDSSAGCYHGADSDVGEIVY